MTPEEKLKEMGYEFEAPALKAAEAKPLLENGTEEEPKARLPANFINGFLEVRSRTWSTTAVSHAQVLIIRAGTQLSGRHSRGLGAKQDKDSVYIALSQYHCLSRAPIRRCYL